MKRNPLYAVGRIVVIPIFKLLFFYKVNGKKNVPDEGAFVVCSNHLSNFDPVLLALTQKRQIFYMAKAELFKNKFLAGLIRTLGAFPVTRGAGDGKAVNEAENLIDDGKLLGIFIEGTRSKTGELLRPKSGAAIIAHQKNVPVIPVCITPKKKFVRVFQKVTISWGKPIMPEELNIQSEDLSEYRKASRLIMERISQLRENDLN